MSISSLQDLWGRDLNYKILHLSKRNRLNEIVELTGELEDWKAWKNGPDSETEIQCSSLLANSRHSTLGFNSQEIHGGGGLSH